MSSIFSAGGRGPKTHVLIIGVGVYPHLLGGEKPNPAVKEMKLGQLSSPPISARAIADWFLNETDFSVPLGSVELLLSERPSNGAFEVKKGKAQFVEAATLANIKAAFERWFSLCNQDPANSAVFYYCGHGVMKTDLLLIPEDFGDSAATPFSKLINFDVAYRSMPKCRANNQFFFVDSCSHIPQDLLEMLDLPQGELLLTASARDIRNRSALRLHASSPGGTAQGRHNQVTRYTKVLIDVLNGLGAQRIPKTGKWAITQNGIAEGMKMLLVREEILGEPAPHPLHRGEGDGTAILRVLSDVPTIPVDIVISPSQAAKLAEYQLFKNGELYQQRSNTSGVWRLPLPVNIYRIEADFPCGTYKKCDSHFYARPPLWEELLTATNG